MRKRIIKVKCTCGNANLNQRSLICISFKETTEEAQGKKIGLNRCAVRCGYLVEIYGDVARTVPRFRSIRFGMWRDDEAMPIMTEQKNTPMR